MQIQHVISTRVLAPEQSNLFTNKGVHIDALNFIEIQKLAFTLPQSLPEVLVVTSKNALNALTQTHQLDVFNNKIVYCVGQTSVSVLKNLPVQSIHRFDSSSQLANALIQNQVKRIGHFCGNLTLASFKMQLTNAHIEVNQYIVYHTVKTPQKVSSTPQTVLFYSPSGVESYFSINEHPVTHAVCIGPTTFKAAKDFATHTHISPETTTQSVVQTALKLIS